MKTRRILAVSAGSALLLVAVAAGGYAVMLAQYEVEEEALAAWSSDLDGALARASLSGRPVLVKTGAPF